MEDAGKQSFEGFDEQPLLPVRRLHNYLYCPRLFYYQWVENLFVDNADTVEGKRAHRNVDSPTRIKAAEELDLPDGSKLCSIKVESNKLGLIGVIDLVEDTGSGAEIVEYKKGSARRDIDGERTAKEADAIQVVAQAMLLIEKGINVTRASVYYAADKRRVSVELNEVVFSNCRQKIAEAKSVASSGKCPPPLEDDPRCLYCSAYPICLPRESSWWAKARSEARPDPQLSFAFAPIKTDLVRERIVEAMEHAMEGRTKTDLEPPRPDRDDGEVLVVQTPGAMIGVRGDQLLVTKQKEILTKMPGRQVRSIYCYGAVQVSAQATSTCLELGIEVSWFSAAGRYIGGLKGLPASGVDARRGQYRLFELNDVRLVLAREIIRAKIHNQRVMLMRNGEAPKRVIKLLASFRDNAPQARNLNELLGVEGAAAALYFEYFDTLLKGRSKWRFNWRGRNRRPPRDPVNALLSMGYSMLAKELAGVCHSVGLDPFLGFLHQPRYGRPALALDLMEEFRPLIADSVAISLINRNEVGPEDFMDSANGTFLNQSGRKAFWESWFRRMDAEVKHPEFGYKMAYRRMFEVQSRQLWRFVRGESPAYHGFTTR
ncbi:CRISPR-associated endonuclease Cas1 [Verrucomicrobia bacterium]|nr:CRISPR-associated endonuclease Cas1 [Verrucomicrobiota bacterium]